MSLIHHCTLNYNSFLIRENSTFNDTSISTLVVNNEYKFPRAETVPH